MSRPPTPETSSAAVPEDAADTALVESTEMASTPSSNTAAGGPLETQGPGVRIDEIVDKTADVKLDSSDKEAEAEAGEDDTEKSGKPDAGDETEPAEAEDKNNAYDPFDEPEGPIEASVATLKPTASKPNALHFLSADTASTASATYIDPTPATPLTSHPPSRSPSNAASFHTRSAASSASPTRSDTADDYDKRYLSEDDGIGARSPSASRSEIQSIMEQFSGDGGGPDAEEVMSPRLEMASPMLATPLQPHPPRKSSLEPLAPTVAQQIRDMADADGADQPGDVVDGNKGAETAAGEVEGKGTTVDAVSTASVPKGKDKAVDDQGPPVPPKDAAAATSATTTDVDTVPISPTMSMHRPPPPEPEPEPALPFDFHRFLEQLRNKKADPVARYLKSFLSEFGKRQWMVHEQVKIISDFLTFIANKMAVCEVWRDLSDAEFDNAREGMEKLVMNRLYSQTFSPAIPPPQPIPGAKPKRRGGERPMGPGRRGQHQEDVERDEILSQKINIYGWIREPHLDIAPVGSDSGRRFLKLAQQELLKIKSYRAPRDKIICVLNCCKVIFGLLKHNKADSSADSFMPLLIYVVLQANPDHLVSNVQYILRFRNQDKLGGEAGYYLSSLLGAVQFIENMDRTTLTITDDEFERNVEAAVSAIAEKHRAASPPLPVPPEDEAASSSSGTLKVEAGPSTRQSNESDRDRTGRPTTPRPSDAELGGDGEEKDAITGLLRTIQRPLSTIGRMFSDEPTQGASAVSSQTARGRSPPIEAGEAAKTPTATVSGDGRHALSAEEAAARQASAETAEAQRLHRVEHASIVETLAGMFPDLDRDIISDVVYQKEGRVGLAVDACLALSS